MKELIRTPYKQVFAKIFHTLYEMDKFFKRWLKFIQGKICNLQEHSIYLLMIWICNQKHPTKKTSGPDGFAD
jgi:hypothetical protein